MEEEFIWLGRSKSRGDAIFEHCVIPREFYSSADYAQSGQYF